MRRASKKRGMEIDVKRTLIAFYFDEGVQSAAAALGVGQWGRGWDERMIVNAREPSREPG
jgi:hypothetical protein